MLESVCRDDVQMNVGNLESRDDEGRTLATECSNLGIADPVGEMEQVGRLLDGQVRPTINLLAGDDEDVTLVDRIDRHDRHGRVVAMDEGSWQLSCDDPCEDARHDATLVVVTGAPSRIATVPNFLTAVRLATLPFYLFLLFSWDDRPLAALLLGFLGITDWVDGWVARHFDQRSDFGAVFDPVVDRLLFLVGTGAAMIDGALPIWFAVAVLAREFLVGATMTLATALGMERFPVSTLGKRYTFLLMVSIPLLILSASEHPTAELALAFGWLCAVPGLVLSWVTAAMYVPRIRAGLRAGRTKRALR